MQPLYLACLLTYRSVSAGPLFAPSPWDPSDEDPFLWQDRLTLNLTLTLTLALVPWGSRRPVARRGSGTLGLGLANPNPKG